MWENELYEQYHLLLPAKEDGGLLILTLYSRIQNRELTEPFRTEDIKLILEQIAVKYSLPTHQSERIIKNLLHYFLRQVPDRHGLFTLTEHAKRLVELMAYKLNNPYKNFPLKENFDKYFFFRLADIKTYADLAFRFGREFSAGHKRIILDHLEALEDELTAAYKELNLILNRDADSATTMVNRFVIVFKTFGERAEDISHSIASKDSFLSRLRLKVDEFYAATTSHPPPATEAEWSSLRSLQGDWRRAEEIYTDLYTFFKDVEAKVVQIRKHILKASEKLSELQEHFSSRSLLRTHLKKLYHLSLEAAAGDGKMTFPSKAIVREKAKLFFPPYYDFELAQNNQLVEVARDDVYEREQRRAIERENHQQERINQWCAKARQRLRAQKKLSLSDIIGELLQEENDLFVVQCVAQELTQTITQDEVVALTIRQQLETFSDHNFYTWKTELQHKAHTGS